MPVFLKTVIIKNFKSFSKRTVIGPLGGQSFTAIIGPNGSGKSNIMDAISFVLGAKPSAMRVKRLREFVPRVGKSTTECTVDVKVVFNVDNTEKSFTRILRNDETSLYKIDDEVVTQIFYMAELREMGLNIKAENFLIPQGYIECFAMKTPKDLTVMFEETCNSIDIKPDYDRLKQEIFNAEEEINFHQQMKKRKLFQKKEATEEQAETEKYLQLTKQYNRKKLKFQLIQLLLIKKEAAILQNEDSKIKSQEVEYLRDKRIAMTLLERTKSQFKSLSSSFENVEQNILKMENIIQEKKITHNNFKESISYWEKKYNCARESLNSASKARDTNRRIIQELRDESERIRKLSELELEASPTNIIELDNSQVKRYLELMDEVERSEDARDFIVQIKSLRLDQQEDHDKLDNENRRKQELKDNVERMKLKKESLETRLQKLQDLSIESEATLMARTEKVQELNEKIIETRNKSLSRENDIAKITKELSEADTVAQYNKKKEIIRMLKELHSGMYGRLSDLCSPIHSRYSVAVTKAFGKNMDSIVVDTRCTAFQCIQHLKQQKIGIETFLPLDSIEQIHINEQLRDIENPRNVKLLRDVLNISSLEIEKAVLFAAKNTLVCETAEDARMLAKECNIHNIHCVSLDGCFYKRGTISGGQADLIEKAKQWGRRDEQQVFTLKERKSQLMQELRNLPKISVMQSELDIINVQIEGLELRNKYMKMDINDIQKEIVEINKKLEIGEREITASNMTIIKIQNNMQKRNEEIKNLEICINKEKNKIFVNFCNDINVPDISYFEKHNLRIYQEKMTRRMELKQQFDRINNQLHFEEHESKEHKNIESKVLKWERAVEQANAKLNKMREKERQAKIDVEQEETKMLKFEDNYTNVKKNLENNEKKLAELRLQIDGIGKLYMENRKARFAVHRKIEQKKIECNTILKECKMKDIIIPMTETLHRRPEESILTGSSSSIAESSEGCEILTKIDFSQFPKNIRDSTEEDLQNMAKQLSEKLTKIQNVFETVNPDLKIYEKIDLIAQEIQEINTNLINSRNKYNEIRTQFESVKAKRYKLFSNCLEHVAAKIDSIYKDLVNDTSAQAIIFSDNPEEPYADNVIYNCIVPFKGFQPLQYLSGGEKSLASLALLFAIQCYKQIPFLIMDEGDASLDTPNIINVTRFIRSQINNVQFITISLRKELYSNVDVLVGVAVERNARCSSKVFVISLNRYSKEKKGKA